MSTTSIPSTAAYFAVFAVLLALTGLTVWVAFVDLGPLNVVVAIGIAVVKALLVALYFMHLRYATSLTWLFAGAGVVWLLLLIGLVLSDVTTRAWIAGEVTGF